MPTMEGVGGQQDVRGSNNNLYSHIHGHYSERSSGTKTPRTPSVKEATPNYNEMYLSSQERTPRVRNGNGEKPPPDNNNYEQRLPLNERNRSPERSPQKYDRQTENKRMYDSDEEEDEKYKQNYRGTRDTRSPDSQSPNKHRHHGSKHGPLKSMELKGQNKIFDETSAEEDSTSRENWNSSPAGMKSDLISTSQVSIVRKFVKAQAKCLGKHGLKEILCDDEKSTYFQSPKTRNNTQQKAVAAALAFQRWRHTQLKKLFSVELKKLLEEAKEDEACLATLEQELATKDKHLAQLRSQLSHYESASREQMNQSQMHELLGANLQELEKECNKALERASLAEDVLKKRDAEVLRLRERLRSLDEEGLRLDTELQSRIKLLQNDKDSALAEGRVLLAQLARRDEEVTLHCKEIEKLRATIALLADRQTTQQKQVESMKADYESQVNNLQEKLEEAYATTHAKETELASYTERCSGLGQERQNLLAQLHNAVERADLASRRAEELQMKLHCTTEERAKASEDVAGEMVEHLKRLTGHMKELETSVDRTGMCFPAGALQRKAGLAKISAKLAQAEVDALNLITQTDSYEDDRRPVSSQELEDNRKQGFSLGRKTRTRRERPSRSMSAVAPSCDEADTCNISSIDRDIALTKFKNWAAWKWRWAASAARADSLSKQLQEQCTHPKHDFARQNENCIVQRGSAFRKDVVKTSRFDDLSLPEEMDVGTLILKHKLVPLIMSAWRAFTRLSSLERKAVFRNESLNKIMSALPWWIRRVGERRLVERYFFHWQLLALRAIREKSQKQQNRRTKIFPIPQSRLGDREREPPQPFAHQQPQTPRVSSPPPVRDAEVQTAGLQSREAEVDAKPKSHTPTLQKAAPPRLRSGLRAKSEPKTAIPCPTCDIRRRFSGSVQPQQSRNLQPSRKMDPPVDAVHDTTFTAKALRALQTSLQQELRELQDLLSQEMRNMQQIPSANKAAEENDEKVRKGEQNRQALKSIFETCNNLAVSLVDVRSQLCTVEKEVGCSRTLPWERLGLSQRRHAESRDVALGGGGRGSISREKIMATNSGISELKTPRYASPIGRQKGVHSSGQRQQGASSTREPWTFDRDARFHSPSRTRDLRNLRTPQDRQQSYENYSRYGRRFTPERGEKGAYEKYGRRSTPERDERGENEKYGRRSTPERDERGEYENDERYLTTGGRADSEAEERISTRPERRERVRFSRVNNTKEVDMEDDAVCTSSSRSKYPPDYTTVVQILNQDNNKIGEVAIHTSAVASDRGGIADLCGSAREAIRTDEMESQQQQQLQAASTELADEAIDKAPQTNFRSKSAFKSPPRVLKRPDAAPHQQQSILTAGLAQSINSSRAGGCSHLLPFDKRKTCIGSEYASLLRSEIRRLREDRLVDEERNCGMGEGDATTPRDLTPRSSKRPNWRPHYTPTRTRS